MSREQRTRLNLMISEQAGVAATTVAPGRSARTDAELTDEEKATLEDAALDDAGEPRERKSSVFDSPHAADVPRQPASDEDA